MERQAVTLASGCSKNKQTLLPEPQTSIEILEVHCDITCHQPKEHGGPRLLHHYQHLVPRRPTFWMPKNSPQKPSILIWQIPMIERIVLHVQEKDVTAPSFCVDQNPVNYQSPLKVHPTCACNHHCLHSCRWMNVAASATNLHPWPVLDPEEDVIRAVVQYHKHLSRAHAEPLSKIHIIVVAGLSTSYLSGFLTSPKMLFLAVSFSYKPSLAIHCFQWSATTIFSILFIGSPETVFATSKILISRGIRTTHFSILPKHHPALTRLLSAPHSVSILLVWFVWCLIPHAPLQKMLCLCNRSLRHLLCLASSSISFLSCLIAPQFLPPTFILSTFFRLRIVWCVPHHPLLFLICQNTRKILQPKTCPDLCCLSLWTRYVFCNPQE